MQNNKLVVFDLDGTLIDSVPDIAYSINVMLEKFGHPQKSIAEITQMIGNGARNLVIRSIDQKLSDKEIDVRLEFYNAHYTSSGSPKTKVFDGVKEMLFELKKRGYKLAILTNKPQMTTDEVYKNHLQDVGFDAVVGQHVGMKIKPDPTMLVKIMEDLGVEKQNTYFVGDGEPDAQIAQNAGVKGISELWGYRTKEQLEKVGATTFAKTPTDLLKLIK